MPSSYVLTRLASDDLTEIWDYTSATWSEDQADYYLEKIEKALSQLEEHIALSRRIVRGRHDLRSLRVG